MPHIALATEGSVHSGELLTLDECQRRLGLGTAAMRTARRNGLRTVLIGRKKYVLGADLIRYVESLAEKVESDRS